MYRLAIIAAIVIANAATAVVGDAPAAAMTATDAARGCFNATSGARALRKALRACDTALEDSRLVDTDRAATLVNRGIVQMQANNIAAAIADYDAAIGLVPDAAEAYVNKGIALLRLADREADAVEQLSQGIARNPVRPEIAYYWRAMANETLGKNREAYEDYSRAAQLAPEWAEPAEQLLRFQTVRRKTAVG